MSLSESRSRLPDAELEVMQALWAVGSYPAHTSDISARLHRDWKAPTLLKLLSRLEERGFVRGEKAGRANVYTPLISRDAYLQQESRSFLTRLHGGSLSSLVAALYPQTKLTQEDVQELERILNKGGELTCWTFSSACLRSAWAAAWWPPCCSC